MAPATNLDLSEVDEVVIGRGVSGLASARRRHGCRHILAVSVPSDTVSRIHARLVVEGGQWLLNDCGSKNGTSVFTWSEGWVWLRSGSRFLADMDQFRCCEFSFTIVVGAREIDTLPA